MGDNLDSWQTHIKQWEVSQALRNEIDLFRQNMPIVKLLRDDAMRDRHWSVIKALVKDQFDHQSDYFTLDKFMDLHFEKVYDGIKEQWETAQAEFKIESSLLNIQNR